MITVLYFASLREQLNERNEQFDLPAQVSTVGELRQWLCGRGAVWAKMLGKDALVMMSVNQAMSNSETLISEGDEIAFFPPVTGG